jgi:mRNA interferase MazF
MARQLSPRRGDVWLVSLDPTIGHEIQKTRPAVVVTNDLYNRQNWVLLVVPLTTRDLAEIDQVLIVPPEGGLTNNSVTLPDQLRAIDRSRLVKRLGRLKHETMARINRTLNIVLDLL